MRPSAPSPLFRDNAALVRRRGGNLLLMHLPSAAPSPITNTVFQADLNSAAHTKFGLYYPITFEFSMSTGLSGLTGQYRTATSGAWTSLTTYTSANLFNGVNAARFDYAGGFAFLSAAFIAASDLLQFRIIDGTSTPVPLTYVGIPSYYDGRHAAVTVTMDDLYDASVPNFNTALGITAAAHIHVTVGLETAILNASSWSSVQGYIDGGYVEAASHSRNHPNNASEYSSYGYSSEISGSRDDILSNLTLPHEFVPVYIEPNGFEDATVRSTAVGAAYLVLRGYPIPTALDTWQTWNADGSYNTALFSYYTWSWVDNTTYRDAANSKYDSVYNAGGIYHLVDHPWQSGHWYTNSNLSQHIDHIKDKTDVWYAGFGELYLYHYVVERSAVSVAAVA
jgi:hypothetical protein